MKSIKKLISVYLLVALTIAIGLLGACGANNSADVDGLLSKIASTNSSNASNYMDSLLTALNSPSGLTREDEERLNKRKKEIEDEKTSLKKSSIGIKLNGHTCKYMGEKGSAATSLDCWLDNDYNVVLTVFISMENAVALGTLYHDDKLEIYGLVNSIEFGMDRGNRNALVLSEGKTIPVSTVTVNNGWVKNKQMGDAKPPASVFAIGAAIEAPKPSTPAPAPSPSMATRADEALVASNPASALVVGSSGTATVLPLGTGRIAAKVNDQPITVDQVAFVLQQQRDLRPDQVEAAIKQILERLIDQELAIQKGSRRVAQQVEGGKRDDDPIVALQLDAATREVLSRAYFEKVSEPAPKPTPEEIKKYYDEQPALFKYRRIYNLREIAVESKPEQVPALREKLSAAKNIGDFIEYLKANGYRFSSNQVVRAAEQLPLTAVDGFAKMQDGQMMLNASASGVQVLVVVGTREEPLSEEQARSAIEQFLLNDRKRKLIEEDLKTMRAAAKIEYFSVLSAGR